MRSDLIPAAALALIGFTVPAAAADIGYVQEPWPKSTPGLDRYRF